VIEQERARRRPFREALACGLRGWCPHCARGPMFRSRFKMLDECPSCHLTYWPESGYYVGAMYLNFIVSFLLIAPMYAIWFLLDPRMPFLPGWKLAVIWVGGGALLSLGLMRYSYSLWLALDFWLNPWEAGKPPELLSR
jgi:uncharacterized protein (DUF983 family)